jgi:hypothetical protein
LIRALVRPVRKVFNSGNGAWGCVGSVQDTFTKRQSVGVFPPP